jgi:hypothetical protein
MGIREKLAGRSGATAEVVALNPRAENARAQLDDISAEAAQAKASEKSAADAKAREIVSAARVAFDQFGAARLLTMMGRRFVALRLESQQARDFLQAQIVEATGKPLGRETLNAQLEVLRGKARIANDKVRVHVRVVAEGGRYFVNLANAAGEVVVVDGVGAWHIEHNSTVSFVDGVGELPRPVKPESLESAWATVTEFFNGAGVPEGLHLVVATVLVEWLRADTPHPLLDVVGAAGSGKTSLAMALLSLVDPPASGKLPEAKAEEEHLAALAQASHVFVLDNAARLSADSQNLLCRVCYGTDVTARKYYAQDEAVRLPVHCPVIITSVNPAITAADLMNRAIRVPFSPRRHFSSGVVVGEKRATDAGVVLGALLELFAAGLARLDLSRTSTHRLVDFALMGEAIASATGMEAGTFDKMLTAANKETAAEYAEGDLFIRAVLEAVKEIAETAKDGEALPPWRSWTRGAAATRTGEGVLVAITPQGLLDRVAAKGGGTAGHFGRAEWIPATPRALTSILNLKLPVLRDLGITTMHEVKRARQGIWIFQWREGA